MVLCDECNHWVHIKCDNISQETYKEMTNDLYDRPYCKHMVLNATTKPTHQSVRRATRSEPWRRSYSSQLFNQSPLPHSAVLSHSTPRQTRLSLY